MPLVSSLFARLDFCTLWTKGERLLFALGLGLSVCLMGFYYSLSWHRGEDAAVAVMYRPGFGDRDYFPLARQFAEGRFGEGFTFEKRNEGRVGFPALSVLPHGLALKLFGPAGFALVDMVIPAIYFALGTSLLVQAGAKPGVAVVLAFFATLPGFAWFASLLLDYGGRFVHGAPFFIAFLRTWDLRFPRTFVSDLYVLGALHQLIQFARCGPLVGTRWWVVTAIWMGVVLQSDLYAFAALGLASVAIVFVGALRVPAFQRREIAPHVFWGLGVFLVVASPFIYSRLHDLPDIQVRYGVFAIARSRVAELIRVVCGYFPLRFVLWTLLLPWLAWGLLRRFDRGNAVTLRLPIALGVLQLCGLVALPAFVALTGKGVQLYHFRDVAHVLLAWGALAGLALIGAALLDRLAARFRAALPGAGFAAAALMLLTLVPVWGLAKTHAGNASIPRAPATTYPAWAHNYRADLRELGRELAQPRFATARVMATPDTELYAWWTAFRGGDAFLPHAFVSALPEAELQRRLVWFAQLNQLDRPGYVHWLTDASGGSIGVNWLNGNRYQASRIYASAPPEDYTAAERAQIAATSPLDCWHLIVTARERERLGAAFEQNLPSASATLPRLDLMVLTHEYPELRPDPRMFTLAYENETFRLFARASAPPLSAATP